MVIALYARQGGLGLWHFLTATEDAKEKQGILTDGSLGQKRELHHSPATKSKVALFTASRDKQLACSSFW